MVGGARATLHGEAAKLWQAMVNVAPMAFPEIARLNASVSWLVRNAVAAVDSCYTAGGGTSLYDSSPLQRHLRDIHTLSQHAALNEAWLTRAGAALLGRQTGFSY